MEFMDGTWKKEINTWEELVGNNLLNQEAVIEGAVHSIRNMGDVAFIILRRREGLFQTVYENEMANVSIHELKEAMTISAASQVSVPNMGSSHMVSKYAPNGPSPSFRLTTEAQL